MNTNVQQLRQQIREQTVADETDTVELLLNNQSITPLVKQKALAQARTLITKCRQHSSTAELLDKFLMEFSLSNQEGVVLMCLAESLLRVPDVKTADSLIAEKLSSADWVSHLGNSDSTFVNAATWGLMLTGKIVSINDIVNSDRKNWLAIMTNRLGEPVIRQVVKQAMQIMGRQYVIGTTFEEALKRSTRQSNTICSFDMLGEAARTHKDADKYFSDYLLAVQKIGEHSKEKGHTVQHDPNDVHGISVKLSALHPRFEFAKHIELHDELFPRIKQLCLEAKKYNVGLSIDAEEAARLDITLDIFEKLARDNDLKNWCGLGFVLQAYQKRALAVADWLIVLAQEIDTRFNVRLVKGAYWDLEIKRAQEAGLEDYPVFTRKIHSDLSYEVCAVALLQQPKHIYPQFATHNAMTLATVWQLAVELNCQQNIEFQRLYGMGGLLYEKFLSEELGAKASTVRPLRVYAPIGKHQDLLPYLVRRLLENGANSSFINRFLDAKVPVEKMVQDCKQLTQDADEKRNTLIPLPLDLFKQDSTIRKNAKGVDLDCPLQTQVVLKNIIDLQNNIFIDSNHSLQLLKKQQTSSDEAINALHLAHQAQRQWEVLGVVKRAEVLQNMGDLLEDKLCLLASMIVLEAHRTIDDAISEVRESIDFCRYYARQAELMMQQPIVLTGYTGESNHLQYSAKGVFLCISPWNFPLAIFIGQVVAALVCGNAVLAKPAEQTPLIAKTAVDLLKQAGVPTNVLQLLLGDGAEVTAKLLVDGQLSGVAFTGSTTTAQQIHRQLAQREGNIVTLIAETGGVNCLIADSTALPEQLVDDVIQSAFKSAGQRCSALRLLFLPQQVAPMIIELLTGAMQTLTVGDPKQLATDIGPLIDEQAKKNIQKHIDRLTQRGQLIYQCILDTNLASNYLAPAVFELQSMEELNQEIFGPVLHIVRYDPHQIDEVINSINASGYRLTLGVHSRIKRFANYIVQHTHVGNTYINRNIVGAVVGVNPFGGNGLSGTGPKAGGPNYLSRFVTERTITENTTATGGNLSLFALEE